MALSQPEFQSAYTSAYYSDWAIATNQSSKTFGVTVAGEFSAAINNCGLWCVAVLYLITSPFHSVSIQNRLNGIGTDIADCTVWDDWKVCFFGLTSCKGTRVLNSLSSHILQPQLPVLGK
jgi:hypothetical protein